jgi:CRP/FNR family transcriptional regulator
MSRVYQLREYPLFTGLNETELTNLAACLVKRTFAKNAYLYYPGNPGLSIYLVESGLVRQFFCDITGQEFLLNLAGPGTSLGLPLLIDDRVRASGAAAQLTSVVLILEREDLFYFMERSPQFMYNVYTEVALSLRKLFMLTRSLASLDLNGRLAGILLYLAAINPSQESKDNLDLPLTQAEMASWIGASRGRINRAINKLEQRGLIGVKGPTISILDRQELEKLTEGLFTELV